MVMLWWFKKKGPASTNNRLQKFSLAIELVEKKINHLITPLLINDEQGLIVYFKAYDSFVTFRGALLGSRHLWFIERCAPVNVSNLPPLLPRGRCCPEYKGAPLLLAMSMVD